MTKLKVRFALINFAFAFLTLFSNPYRVCRKFLQKKGNKEIYAYGETPLETYKKIASVCEIKSTDCWLELGAGRGKGCFWMAHSIGCRVQGIEWVPQFVWIARALKTLFRVHNASFHLQNIGDTDFSTATAVYLYLYEAPPLTKMEQLPLGAKVITVSEPLETPFLTLKKTFSIRYPWGRTQAFLHEKTAYR